MSKFKDIKHNLKYGKYENDKLPDNLMISESKSFDWEKRKAIASNPNIPVEAVINLSKDDILEVRLQIANNPSCPSFVLDELAKDSSMDVVVAVAINKNTSPKTLKNLSKKQFIIQRAVLNNPNCPEEVLYNLSKDSFYELRSLVAKHPKTSIELLEKLSNDKAYSVRETVAGNVKTPANILKKLSNDDDISIREAVASNPSTSQDVLAKLSTDRVIDVRRSVAENNNCSKKILEYLSREKELKDVPAIVKYKYDLQIERRSAPFNKLVSSFKSDNLTEEEKNLKEELEQKKMEEDLNKQLLNAKRESIIEHLRKIEEEATLLDSKNVDERYKISKKIKVKIPDSELFIKVDNHFEFNPEYIRYLNYIDLSLVGSDNLKVSGIDFSETNINIDPQRVYNKDLSGCRFGDDNIVFKSFEGCNLSGCDISDERESMGIENAYYDENTKLPYGKGRGK